MKDLHNHLLYGIDDGAETIEESLKILTKLEKEGVKEIVLTPHYIIGTNFKANNKKKKELVDTLKTKTNIKLYYGNEVFIDNDIIKYIQADEISTINNSRYLLIEFPLRVEMPYSKNIIFELRRNNIIPIIAHPERYVYYEIKDLQFFLDEGCLFQGNITSLGNKYGKNAKKRLITMLKKDMIAVLGTDTHSCSKTNIAYCEKELAKIVSKEKLDILINKNFDIIVNNKVIKD